MDPRVLNPGDAVQLSPEVCNRAFAGCVMIVTEPKSWGAIGYVQICGDTRDAPGPQAYYRAEWSEMEYIGRAAWIIED